MPSYIRMKRNQWKVRAALYAAAATVIDDHKEILALLQRMYTALKDVPPEDLREALVSRMAEMIHND